jgi:hypothetical protein
MKTATLLIDFSGVYLRVFATGNAEKSTFNADVD